MEYSKHRFEFFSDGFMAIVMTIMVLEIHVSKSFAIDGIDGIEELLKSILIYFISFFIVGWFLNRHHHLIDNTKKITSKIIWKNLVFLFFVALIPIFTKLIIENNANNMAIIAYDIVFLLANISFQILNHESWKQIPKEVKDKIREERIKSHKRPYFKFVLGSIILLGLVVLSIIFPKFSIIMYIIFPIIFALMNIFFEHGPKKDINYENEL